MTDRGTELANRLRFLRLAEQTMGAKHPSFESVLQEIEDIKTELTAWSSHNAELTTKQNQTVTDSENEYDADFLPEMNDRDLRQLVLRLVGRVRQLEDRIEAIEAKVSARTLR